MLIDSMRRHLLISDSVNIEAHLRHIRQQRAKLVQTLVCASNLRGFSFRLKYILKYSTTFFRTLISLKSAALLQINFKAFFCILRKNIAKSKTCREENEEESLKIHLFLFYLSMNALI